jgi:hypothetical protein
MGFLKWLPIFIIIGFLVWTFIPTGLILGEETFDIEVTAIAAHGTFTTLPDTFTITDVDYKVEGVSSNFNWGGLLGIGTFGGSFEFCIEDNCQWNEEEFSQITFGESVTSTETISGVTPGTHTLTVNFYTKNVLRDTHQESITV